MNETRRTSQILSTRAPRWAVAVWRGARVAISTWVAALHKAGANADEARARDHEERVFHPRKH